MARPRQVSDAEILETARRCFLEQGPSVSTDVIAGKLGVSSQALFKRFGSKQELMLAAIRPPAVPPWTATLEAGPNDQPIRIQLAAIVEEVSVYFAEMARRMSLVRWSGVPIEELLREYDPPPPQIGIRALARWLERAHQKQLIRATDFQSVATALLGSLHAPVFLAEVLQQQQTAQSRKAYVTEVVNLFARGLEPDT
jgi:AcrR family transcriptional regulator